MKTVNHDVRILDIPEPTDEVGVLMYLEQIGRLCYKSEDKITEESCFKFIENLFSRKHWAMLEHYIFVLSVPKEVFDDVTDRRWLTAENTLAISRLGFIHPTYWKDAPNEELKYLISGSATAFNYLQECECFNVEWEYDCGVQKIYHYMASVVPHLMGNIFDARTDSSGIRFLSREEVTNLPIDLRRIHDFRTCIMRTDRGVTHELVRHRPVSWAQESTRYCNYSTDKFDNNITYLEPSFFNEKQKEHNIWEDAMLDAESHYNDLIALGAKPQEARSVLPHSTKVDIAMTATLMEYDHFFKMRLPKSAHPQMREIAIKMLHLMQHDISARPLFSDMVCDSLDVDLKFLYKEAK